MLRELTNVNLPLGGKIMIIGGDFKQILPIQRRARRNELANLSVRQSGLWKEFEVFRLIENQIVLQTIQGEETVLTEREDFAKWALKVRNGEVELDEEEFMEIPERVMQKMN